MGSTDKLVRILVAVIIVGLYYTDYISGTLATILLIIAGIFVVTSFIGTCPLYLPFGISTRKRLR